jgi:hypothetical protein
LQTINKRTVTDGYKIVATVIEVTAEQDTYVPVRQTPLGRMGTSYEQPMKFKYTARCSTSLGELVIPVNKDFVDEMNGRALGTTLEITIVSK